MSIVLLAAASALYTAQQAVASQLAVGNIIRQLDSKDLKYAKNSINLINAAPSMVVHFQHIIDSPVSKSRHIALLYGIIADSEIDRKMFLQSAVRDVGHGDVWVRMAACAFVGAVGTAADSAPLLVMLFDPKIEAVYAATKALALIGDDRTVIALDLWLRIHRRPPEWAAGDMTIENAVIKSRDQIKARLAAAAKPAPVPPK